MVEVGGLDDVGGTDEPVEGGKAGCYVVERDLGGGVVGRHRYLEGRARMTLVKGSDKFKVDFTFATRQSGFWP